MVESLRPQIEKSKISLDTAIAPCPLWLTADPQRLGQVVINFLTNAMKFSPRGSRVRLRAEVRDGRLVCEVHDQGPGIRPEDQHKLFQRYSQLPGSTRKGGAGLGLSISKALIDAHGGTIGVRSTPGEGSIFWFTLPVGP